MKLSSGSEFIDEFLAGGYEQDIINTIYGPAGSGKTLLCILALIEVVKSNKKVIFVDTEGGFSFERLKQITPDYEKILENTFFLKPTNFNEQKESFEKLKDIINDKIGLIVVDTLSMLYRLEMGKNEDIYEVNKILGQQLAYLNEIARKNSIPVLITNQVYSSFEQKDKVNIVGGDLLKYSSKCMLEMQAAHGGHRRIILRKHRSLPSGKDIVFRIVEKGIESVK